jgi:hypothetical protein
MASIVSGTGTFWVSAVVFIGVIIYTVVLIGQNIASPDDHGVLTQISYVNGGLIALMTLIAFSFTNAYPAAKDKYILLITHLALFLGIMAVSILAIQKF